MDMVFLGMVDPQSNYSWYFWLFHCLTKVDLSWQCVSNYNYSYTKTTSSPWFISHTRYFKKPIYKLSILLGTHPLSFLHSGSFVISSFWILSKDRNIFKSHLFMFTLLRQSTSFQISLSHTFLSIQMTSPIA